MAIATAMRSDSHSLPKSAARHGDRPRASHSCRGGASGPDIKREESQHPSMRPLVAPQCIARAAESTAGLLDDIM